MARDVTRTKAAVQVRTDAPSIVRRSLKMLVAVTDHAAERFRQRVRGTLDEKTEIASRVPARTPPVRSSRAQAGRSSSAISAPRRRLRVPARRGRARRDHAVGGRRGRRRAQAIHRRPAPRRPPRQLTDTSARRRARARARESGGGALPQRSRSTTNYLQNRPETAPHCGRGKPPSDPLY